jgi:hypothetical protein
MMGRIVSPGTIAAMSALASTFAPTGRLRAAINTGNAVLARKDVAAGAAGVSVDLAAAFAKHLGVPLELVVVGKGSAYDLHLTRELKAARIVRAPTSPTVVDVFVEQGCEVAAGVKQQLEADAKRFPGHRLLPGRFMVIQQAMGLPKGRGDAAHRVLADFVEEMKRSGFVADALARHGIAGASVAPAA